MKVAYVSGPYRGKSEWEVYRNIETARQIAAELWKAGYAVICPHSNTAFFGGIVPDDTFLQGDLAILERCDLVVLVPGWERSEGAKAEKEFAEACGIPVYEWEWDYMLLDGVDNGKVNPREGDELGLTFQEVNGGESD